MIHLVKPILVNSINKSIIDNYYQHYFFIFNLMRSLLSIIKEVTIQTYINRQRVYTDYFIKIDFNYLISCFKILSKSLFFNYDQLSNLTCVDNLNLNGFSLKERFSLFYILTKINKASRLIISFNFPEKQMVNSITNLYKNAHWLEREAFDMFGVFFTNHSDLRRLLTDYGFKGFPLRKDFPLTGYLELRYNEEKKYVKYKKLVLMQEYRFFNFASPWVQYKRTSYSAI